MLSLIGLKPNGPYGEIWPRNKSETTTWGGGGEIQIIQARHI